MGNTTANTFASQGANAKTEYKGYNITRAVGRKGFTIKPSAGEVPRSLRGHWLKLEEAHNVIDSYLAQPEVVSRNEAKVAKDARKDAAASLSATTKKEDTVNAKGDSK